MTNGTTVPNVAEMKQQLATAMQAGDWKLVQKLSSVLAKAEHEKIAAMEEAKAQLLVAATMAVKELFDLVTSAIMGGDDNFKADRKGWNRQLTEAINSCATNEAMLKADGVWYSRDFGTTEIGCKLFKSKARAAGGATRVGDFSKKFAVKTDELLAQFADEVYDGRKIVGLSEDASYAVASEFAKTQAADKKNATYNVRRGLLVKGGYIGKAKNGT